MAANDGRRGGSFGILRNEHGDFRERAETFIQLDFARFEKSVGAGLHLDDRANKKSGRKNAAKRRRDEAFGVELARVDIEGDELDHAARGAKSLVGHALEADGPHVALDAGGEPDAWAADEFDHGGVGVDFADPAYDATAENHWGADRDAEILPFANNQLLPPSRKIAPGHACRFVAIAGQGREAQHVFEPGDFRVQIVVLLHGDVVGSVESREVASRLDEFAVRVQAKRPVFAEIRGVGGGDADGCGEFEERRAGKNLNDRGHDQPPGDDQPEGDKRVGLVETFGRHDGSRRMERDCLPADETDDTEKVR